MNDSAADNSESPLAADLYKVNRVIADTASDAIITVDEDSTMVFVNGAAEKIFGYSRAELLGQSLTMLVPDYLRQVHRAGMQRYGETGPPNMSWEGVALPGLHKSGREIPLEISLGEFTENGRRFFTGIARDITERLRLEGRLDAQFQVARTLAESDTIGGAAPSLLQAICDGLGWDVGHLWILDRGADALHWLTMWRVASVSATELEGASRNRTLVRGEGFPGRIWARGTSEWIADIAAEPDLPRMQFAMKAGLRSAFGFPIMVDKEVLGVMELFSLAIQPADDSVQNLMSSIGNQIGQFVERRRAEGERAQIYDREQRAWHEVQTTMELMRQVQTVTDVALSHLAMDELLAELLTRVREAMNVDTVAILLLEPEGDELVAWAARGLEEEVEVGVRIPVGKGFAGRVAKLKSPVRIDDLETADILNPLLKQKGIRSLLGVPLLVEGRVIGVMHTGRFARHLFTEDDTRLLQLVADRVALAIENARLFEEERTARRDAEAASRAKDEFLTTISHELRTPLTPLIGWIHMIRNGILPEKETVHGLEVIEKNSHALKRLINDLLDMSAILSGKMRMEELPVPLDSVVREAVETVRPLASNRDIEVTVEFHEWQHGIVNGDRARLSQVFWNLLTNAIKFSSPGGRVRIDAETNDLDAIVSIRDAGQGITSDFLPFVFERFRQADGSKTRLHGGLGLGLALVKSLVEAHQGTVEVESAGAGQGSLFRVRLPLRRSRQFEETPEPPAELLRKSVHLMIVEDDPDTLEMLRATLEARGFRVTACESAAQSLAVASAHQVDLIISDIGMPAMDGFQMIKRLREISGYREVPAIALSGYASEKDARSALAAGFDAHVSKPVNPAELVLMVNGLLQRTSSVGS